MNTDALMKYLIWIIFFSLAITGMYAMLKNLGILG